MDIIHLSVRQLTGKDVLQRDGHQLLSILQIAKTFIEQELHSPKQALKLRQIGTH